jgi:hypothetical protein
MTSLATTGTTVIAFGGYNESGYLGDTWSWDGNTWTQLNVAGPSARFAGTMTSF